MKKLKGFLEASAGRLLGYALIGSTVAGGAAAALLVGTAVSAGVAFASIMAGTYLGFVAGYVAIARAPEKFTGLKKSTVQQDVKTAAMLPIQGAAEMVRLIRQPFNRAAYRTTTEPAPASAPAPQEQPAASAPKP